MLNAQSFLQMNFVKSVKHGRSNTHETFMLDFISQMRFGHKILKVLESNLQQYIKILIKSLQNREKLNFLLLLKTTFYGHDHRNTTPAKFQTWFEVEIS